MPRNNKKNIKSRFCQHIGTACDPGCTFAHTISELRPLKCTTPGCVDERCYKIHEYETKRGLAKRLGFVLPNSEIKGGTKSKLKYTKEVKIDPEYIAYMNSQLYTDDPIDERGIYGLFSGRRFDIHAILEVYNKVSKALGVRDRNREGIVKFAGGLDMREKGHKPKPRRLDPDEKLDMLNYRILNDI